MSFHNWSDALAVANARAQVTGQRQRVRRGRYSLTWRVVEVGR